MAADAVLQRARQALSDWGWPPVLLRRWAEREQFGASPAPGEQDTGSTFKASGPSSPLRILSFNLLADCKQKNEAWMPSAEEALSWKPRRLRLLEILLQDHPDIICVQELDVGALPELKDAGYAAFSTDTASDCVAVFFRTDRLELLSCHSLDFAAVAVLRDVQLGTTAVASAHFQSGKNELAETARSGQVCKLFDFMQQLAADHVVVACDLNAVPKLESAGEASAYWTARSHSLNLHSAYEKAEEPEYTTWKLRPKGN